MQQDYSYIPNNDYQIWMIRNATKYNLTDSEYHPNQIKQEIESLQDLLKEATN